MRWNWILGKHDELLNQQIATSKWLHGKFRSSSATETREQLEYWSSAPKHNKTTLWRFSSRIACIWLRYKLHVFPFSPLLSSSSRSVFRFYNCHFLPLQALVALAVTSTSGLNKYVLEDTNACWVAIHNVLVSIGFDIWMSTTARNPPEAD